MGSEAKDYFLKEKYMGKKGSVFSGQIRVLLRDESHTALVAGANVGEVNDAVDGWRVTLLFVHKA